MTRSALAFMMLLALPRMLLAEWKELFTHVPLELERVKRIIPLGNLNPRGGHVLPTDHIYFDYGGTKDLSVIAPAGGTVIAVREQLIGDASIEIRINEDSNYYINHLIVAGIKPGDTIKPGQILGKTTGRSWLDLGYYMPIMPLQGFANPKRYSVPTLTARSPFPYYARPLRQKLYDKVDREGEDKDGKIVFDIRGKLIGNWFHEGLAEKDSGRGAPKVWAKQLAFVPDVHKPKERRVSIGGTIAPAGLYRPSEKSPDPATVTVKSGPVLFQMSWNEKGKEQQGVLLVEMLTDERIRVQFFEGDIKEKPAFTTKAVIYVR